jgi:hypothetical protein
MRASEQLAAVEDDLEAALTALLQTAPAYAPSQLERAAALALELALCAAEHDGPGQDRVALGCALEGCLDLLPHGRVDAGAALPALVMAAHSSRVGGAAVAAARYEVETLLPIPGAEPVRSTANSGALRPDVLVHSLRRRVAGEPAQAGRTGSAPGEPAARRAERWRAATAGRSPEPVARVAQARDRVGISLA